MEFNPQLIVPKPGSRSIILGQTGTGKTYLGRRIFEWLKPGRRFLLIDPKHELEWYPGAVPVGSRRGSDVLIYRPSLRADVVGELDSILEQVYQQGEWEIYIDELFGCQVDNKYPSLLVPILTMGRTRGIGFTSLAQRPRNIPINVMAQSQQQYIFRLPHSDDRDVVKGLIGDRAKFLPPKYSFWFNSYELQSEELPTKPLRID